MPGSSNKLTIKKLGENLQLGIAEPGRPAATVVIPAKSIGLTVTALLDCAKTLAGPSVRMGEEGDWMALKPTAISLGSIQGKPGSEALVFAFGAANVAVHLTRAQLLAIGEGMMRLGKDGAAS